MLASRSLVTALAVSVAFSACTHRDSSSKITPERPARPSAEASPVPARLESREVVMSFFELIQSRHSVRAFTAQEVKDEAVKSIVAAANRAPSAGNQQAYEVVAVRDSRAREKLASAALGQAFVAEAPVVLVFLAHPARSAARYGERGSRLYALQDATIAAAYAQLAAAALGLGSVWVGAVDDDAVLAVVGAPKACHFSSLLVIGHPAERGAATNRRPDILHEERMRAP